MAPLETAGGSELSFLGGRKAMQQADFSAAGCLIVPPDYPSPSRRTVIRAPEPRTAFARAMNRFYPTMEIKPGIHPTAVIGKDVEIGALAAIGAHVQHRRQHPHRPGQQHRPRLLHRQARGAGRRLRAARQRHDLRQRGHRTRRDPALRLRDRRGRIRLRLRERPLSQVPAGGPRGDRRLRGDRREFVRGPRRAGRHGDRRRHQTGQHGARGPQLPHRAARGGGGADRIFGRRGGGGLRGDRRTGGYRRQGAHRIARGAGIRLRHPDVQDRALPGRRCGARRRVP